jgi:hypothetical protein
MNDQSNVGEVSPTVNDVRIPPIRSDAHWSAKAAMCLSLCFLFQSQLVHYGQFLNTTGIRPSDGSAPQGHFTVVVNTEENDPDQ